MPDLIDTNEAMRLLGIGRSTLQWLTESGTLEPLTYTTPGGKRRLFLRRDQVERLAAEGWRRTAPRKK